MTLITSAGTAPLEAATPSAAKPRLTNSKAVGAPTPDGVAFVPHTSRVLGQHRAGVERGGEVMRDLHLASPPVPRAGDDPVRPSKHSVCAQSNQMLIGFIHNRLSKRLPRQERVGARALMTSFRGRRKDAST